MAGSKGKPKGKSRTKPRKPKETARQGSLSVGGDGSDRSRGSGNAGEPRDPTESVFVPASAVKRNLRILVYGPYKVGKTEFALSWPGVVVVDMERGTDHKVGRFDFSVFQTRSAKKAFGALLELEKTRPPFLTLSIDSLSVFWDACQDGMRAKLAKQANPRDDFVLGDWPKIKAPYRSFLTLAANLPYNVILIARETDVLRLENGEMTVVGTRPACEKHTGHFVDVVMRMRFDEAKGHVGVIEGDYTNTFPRGTEIESPSYDDFAPIIETTQNPARPEAPPDKLDASDSDLSLFANEQDISAVVDKNRALAVKLGLNSEGMSDVYQSANVTHEGMFKHLDAATAVRDELERRCRAADIAV